MTGRGRGINLPHWMTVEGATKLAADTQATSQPASTTGRPPAATAYGQSGNISGQVPATAPIMPYGQPGNISGQVPVTAPIMPYGQPGNISGQVPATAPIMPYGQPGNIPGQVPATAPIMPYGQPGNIPGQVPATAPIMPYGQPGNIPPGGAMPSFPRPLPFMGGMPLSMPRPMSMPIQMQMQMHSGVMPGGTLPMMVPSMMPRPMMPSGLPNVSSNSDIDPNTEIVNWSEHLMPDGRKYWYNKVTNLSTYDKPLVLKTPEERSIPPCKWKEYVSNDGKKYYSDGVESKWEPPEEYISWKEKIDAIENKKKSSSSVAAADPVAVPTIVAPTYNTKDEAVNAFKELLNDKKISVTMKIAQVQDLCQYDVRWLALPNQGERKQALAEYQSKKQKQEKELVATKFKKSKDAFLMMLAENTDIAAHTRWREACEILYNDRRFKDIDDPRDREDIYNDFIAELVKKERMDREKERTNALGKLSRVMLELYNNGKIKSKMTLQECKNQIVEVMSTSEIKVIDESDLKRIFFEYLDKVELQMKEEEKRHRDIFVQTIREKSAFIHSMLLPLIENGQINAESRWRDVQDILMSNPSYKTLCLYYETRREALESFGLELVPGKDSFDMIITDIRDVYRTDKRAVKDTLYELKLAIKHNTTLAQFKTAIYRAVGLVPPIVEEIDENIVLATTDIAAEDGEEVEEVRTKAIPERLAPTSAPLYTASHINAIIKQRPFNMDMIFNDLIIQAKRDHEEDERKYKRKTERFIDLLGVTFNGQDHLNLSYEQGMKKIEHHNAYEALDSKDRRRLYTTYMDKLAQRYNVVPLHEHEEEAFVGPALPPVEESLGGSKSKRKRKDSVGSEVSNDAPSNARKSTRGRK